VSGSRSLRSRLLTGSLLWTVGVMLCVSVLLITFLATHPRPHAIILNWMLRVPMALLVLVAGACMAAGAARIRAGLSAMERLGDALASIQRGKRTQIDAVLPGEVQPLVDTLNHLLADREARVQRAITRAGDLAHGLKTPLSVLACEADRAEAIGQTAVAEALRGQVERMQRQVDYHLAHARASAASNRGGVQSAVEPSIDGLFRTLARVYAERAIRLEVSAPGGSHVACRREDLEEMLGNLLDNACKWTRTRVAVVVAPAGAGIAITIDDDGPGIGAALLRSVLDRGVRADERMPGSGLGLAIARDLAEVYGGQLELTHAPGGGLRSQLTLPSAPLTPG